MKTRPTRLKVFLLAAFLCCIGKLSIAQNFDLYVANDHLTSPNVYEFDVFMKATSADFVFRSVQLGFSFNAGFVPSGSTITAVTVASASQLVSPFSSGPLQWNGTFNWLSVPSSSAGTCPLPGPPPSSNTTMTVAGPAIRLCRVQMTSNNPFGCTAPLIGMVRPLDTSPQLGLLKCSVSMWSAGCVATTISSFGTYSTFMTTLGGPTLTGQISNLSNITGSPVSPASAQLCSGTGSQTFSVQATGNGTNTPLSYQWTVNGSPVNDDATYQGTHTSTLTVTNPSSGGQISCLVTQCSPTTGTFTAAPATLNVVLSDDGNLCTIDACDPATGIVTHTPINTNDNNVCTADGCDPATGNATHTPISVDDNNPCTADNCDPVNGPSHTQIDFSDANLCDVEACDPATGFISHTLISTTDNNQCTTDACDPATGQVSHTPVSTTDNDLCTTDACDPATGQITHTQIPTSDNNLCTTDACDPATGFVSHTPVSTTDNDLCTTDACNPATGQVTHTPVATTDNDLCTTDACDPTTGQVTHTPVVTSDNDLCTTDACNPATGQVTHTPVTTTDNNLCTTDACDPATGQVTHTPVSTTDNNACTIDACAPATGQVTHTPISTNDNNACTVDGCDPLLGEFHTPVDPNDNNLCTNDFCDPQTGVHNDPLPNINDNDACTQDVCDPTSGFVTHTPVVVDDNNLCTIDGCDPVNGPYHNSIPTDDFNPCTIDACDPTTGIVSNIDATPSINVSYTPISCFGGMSSVTVTGSGGQGTLTGTGTFSTTGGITSYTISDAAGCSVSQAVFIPEPLKITIDNIGSTPTGCSGSTGSLSAAASGGTGALSYVWNPGNLSGANQSNIGAGNYTVTVTDQNGCTATSTVAVTQQGGGTPNPPGPLTGPTIVCKGQCGLVYTVPAVAGATSYIWTMPQGMTGSSTGNSISICITSKFRGGFICVRVVNACGTSTATCLNVLKAKDKPKTPASIFGPSVLCANQTAVYQISAVQYAQSYVWSGNNGLQILLGQGTTTVTVKAPLGWTGGTLKVYAKNCKGNSGTKSKNIKNGIPGNPGAVNGPNSVCKSQTKAYNCGAAPNATSYTWAVTGGATIASGQGTTNITVNYNTATLTTSVVSVVANGPCGSSAPKTRTVAVNLTCRTAGVADANVNPVYDLSAYPNPTSGRATVTFNVTENTKCMMRVMDVLGNVLISENVTAVEGPNSKELHLENYAKGVYFVSIQTENNDTQTLRVVVE
jgi:hypothetical protein